MQRNVTVICSRQDFWLERQHPVSFIMTRSCWFHSISQTNSTELKITGFWKKRNGVCAPTTNKYLWQAAAVPCQNMGHTATKSQSCSKCEEAEKGPWFSSLTVDISSTFIFPQLFLLVCNHSGEITAELEIQWRIQWNSLSLKSAFPVFVTGLLKEKVYLHVWQST